MLKVWLVWGRDLETRADQVIDGVNGHRSLKKAIKLLAHLFELCREHGASEQVGAFVVQVDVWGSSST